MMQTLIHDYNIMQAQELYLKHTGKSEDPSRQYFHYITCGKYSFY